MATQTTGGGSTSSFTNTPQAKDDSYAYLEDLLRADATLYNSLTNTLILDVMSNDLGGNAKTLFSVEDGDGNPITADFDLLTKDVNAAGCSPWECTLGGNWVRINNGKIEYRIADGSGIKGQGVSVDSLTAGQLFTDEFVYAIRLGNGTISEATVKISITGANDSATIGIDGTVANDRAVSEAGVNPGNTPFAGDPDASGKLTISDDDAGESELQPIAAGTAGDNGYGTFQVLANGQWTYTLNNGDPDVDKLAQGAVVYDMITVTSEDGTDIEVITITITGTNDGPVANLDTGSAGENESKAFDVVLNDTDVDDGAVLTLFSIDGVTVGGNPASAAELAAFSMVGGQVQFTPGTAFDHLALGASASVVVSYTVKDQHGASASSTLTLTVTGTNDGPVANLDTGSAGENESKAFDVVLNDTDVDDGAVLTLFSIDGVTVGGNPASAAELAAFSMVGGQVQFTPGTAFDHLALGASASVVVSYTVKDQHGASASSTLTLTVTGTNDGPVANLDTGSAGENESKAFDVVLNDTDVDDGAVLTLFSIDGVTVGGNPASAAELAAFSMVGGQVQFTPGTAFDHLALGASASVVVSYTVKDQHGASASSTLTLTVTGTNDGPVANLDTGSAGENESKAFDVVLNDTDVDDGAVLTLFSIDGVTVGGNPASAAELAAFSMVGGQVQFTPGTAFDHLALGASASVVVSYTVKDQHGASASSTLTLTVTGTNDGPVANLDTGSAGENESKAFDVVLNDTDVDDGAVLTLFSIDGVTVGGNPASAAELAAFSMVGGQVQFTPGTAFDHLALGASASVVVSYTVKDQHGASASSTLTLTVTGTNDGPVANLDTGSAGENESKAFDVVLNDTDVDDGAVLTLFSIDGVTVGGNPASAAELAAFSMVGGQVQFTPGTAFDHLALGASASVVVSYTVKDQHGASASSTLTLTVTGTNDGPVANLDTGSAGENESKAFDVVLNDTDVDDGAVLTLFSIDGVTVGGNPASAAELAAFSMVGGQVQFTPGTAFDHLALGASASVVVSYTVKDQHGASASSTLTLTVTGTNDGPVANLDTGSAGENESKAFDVVLNDTDVDDGAVLTLFSIDGVTVGGNPASAAELAAFSMVGGQVQFTPGTAFDHLALGASASVVVSYTVKDQHGASASSTLTLTVTGTNDGPVANLDTGSAGENESKAFDVVLNDTDVDDGAVLTLFSIDGVTVGGNPASAAELAAFSMVGGQVQFTPGTAFDHLALGASASVVVSYTVKDQHGASASSTLTLTVTGTNDGPVANLDTGSAGENESKAFDVVLNDTDVDDGAVLTLFSIDGVTVGGNPASAAELAAFSMVGGQVQFTPGTAFDHLALGASASVVVSYTVKDQHGASASSTLTLTVTGTNDGPVANLDTGSAGENESKAFDVVLNDTDVDDGAVLTLFSIDGVTVGGNPASAAELAAFSMVGGQVQFTPGTAFDHLALGASASVVVSYTVKDQHGASASSTLTLTVTGTNDGPVAVDDSGAGNEDSSISGSVAANDSDVDDGAALSYAVIGSAPAGFSMDAAGNWTLNAANAAYQHLAAGATTVVTVGYTVSDGLGGSDVGELKITVTGVNDDPALTGTQATLAGGTEDQNYIVSKASLLTGFSDVDDGSVLGIFGLTANHGSVIDNGNGTYTIVPNANYNGVVILSYSVVDGLGGSVPATLSFNLAAVNDPAVIAGTSTGTVVEATPSDPGVPSVTGTLTAADVDNPPNTFIPVAVPTASANGYGTFTMTAGGAWTYALNNANPTVNALMTGMFLLDSFTVQSADGTTKTINITINGATDLTTPATFTGTGDPNDFDSLVGTSSPGFLLVNGTAAGETLTGDTSANDKDIINGFAGDDTINAGDATDQVYGGTGNDIINGGENSDVLYGQAGIDTIHGNTNGDDIYGGSDGDFLFGDEASDNIFGGSGNDTIDGGGSDDVIVGGYGADSLTGGTGDDTFRYLDLKDTNDTILDFMDSGNDQIDLSALDANSAMALNQAFGWGGSTPTANSLWFSESGGNTTLYGDTDGNVATAEFMILLPGFTGFNAFNNPLTPPPDITF